jgi:hypothetical protein
MKKSLLLVFLAVFATVAANAQIVLTNGVTSTTSFSGWGGTLPSGFTVTGESTLYRGSSQTLSSGGLYDYNGFNYQPSSSADNLQLTGSYQNGTGDVISTLTISYDAFTVYDRTSRVPSWEVTVNGQSIGDLTWTYGDGNQTLSATLNGLNIAAGDTITLVFSSDRGIGSNSTPKIGLNNVSLTAGASAIPEPSTYAAIIGGLALGFVYYRRRKASKAA